MKSSVRMVAAGMLLWSAAAHADDKAVTLARTFKEGDKFTHKVTVNASLNGAEVIVSRTAKSVVKEVKKTGEVVIVQTDEGVTLNIAGAEQQQPAGPPVTEIRDKNGKLTELKVEESGQGFMTPEIQQLVARVSDVSLTDKPVKGGDVWTAEFENPAVKGKKFSVKSTYVGIEKVDGQDLWKIKQVAEADTDADGKKLSMDFTAWLDPVNGLMVKMEGNGKDIPTVAGPVSWTMKQVLVKTTK